MHVVQSASTGPTVCVWVQDIIHFHSTRVLSVHPSCISHSPAAAVDEVQWWFMILVHTAGTSARAMSSLRLNLILLGSCTKMLLCRGQVKGGSMMKVAGCSVPTSQQLLQIEPLSDIDQTRCPCHRVGADPLTLRFLLGEWTWCQWKHLLV